jgi:hypothetical protein
MLNLVLISLATGAVVRSSEIYASVSAARRALNRDPDFAENKMISWENVGLFKIGSLMIHGEEPDLESFEIISEWHAQYKSEEYFWSLFFNEKENV